MIQPLSDFEWNLLWMALRYALGRQSIACATLPDDIIINYYSRLTDQQKQQLSQEVKDYIERCERMNHPPFSHEREHWIKFMKALDVSQHFEVETTEWGTVTCFEFDDYKIPLDKYIERPFILSFIPAGNIK